MCRIERDREKNKERKTKTKGKKILKMTKSGQKRIYGNSFYYAPSNQKMVNYRVCCLHNVGLFSTRAFVFPSFDDSNKRGTNPFFIEKKEKILFVEVVNGKSKGIQSQ